MLRIRAKLFYRLLSQQDLLRMWFRICCLERLYQQWQIVNCNAVTSDVILNRTTARINPTRSKNLQYKFTVSIFRKVIESSCCDVYTQSQRPRLCLLFHTQFPIETCSLFHLLAFLFACVVDRLVFYLRRCPCLVANGFVCNRMRAFQPDTEETKTVCVVAVFSFSVATVAERQINKARGVVSVYFRCEN